MDIKEVRIVFMGTPTISANCLRGLIEHGFNIVAVITQADKKVGRKEIITKSPVKLVAEEYNIPVYTPIKIRLDYEFLKEINPDLILTFAYGQIVPQGVLDIPRLGCLNLHGSLLPKYRGASPIQAALFNNEEVTGVTLMEMIKQMDAGRMYAKKEVRIEKDDNATSLFNKIGDAGLELALEALPKYVDGLLEGVPQDESLVSFCGIIKPEDEKIDVNCSAKTIYGLIRGLSDNPGAYLYLDEAKIKIYKADYVSGEYSGENGEIIQADKNGLLMKCHDGAIKILELQKEGKKRMDYRSFINGNQNLLHRYFK